MTTLKNKIARMLCSNAADNWEYGEDRYLAEADAILAVVIEYATSDEAVERAKQAESRLAIARIGYRYDKIRAIIQAAIGGE